MPALNHLIVPVKDKDAAAEFLARILGIEAGPQWGPFRPVQMSNGVTLDFISTPNPCATHYAFLVDDAEFEASFGRIREAGIPYYAHPSKSGAGEINHLYGGRGVYFEDRDGHMLELITRPYGDPPA